MNLTHSFSRRCSAHGIALTLLAFLSTAASAPAPAPPPVARLHTAAVEMARAGDFDEALAVLAELHRRAPDHLGILRDTLVILTWAGRDRAAFALIRAVKPESSPIYVLEAAARAARNIGHFDEASRLYGLILAREPEHRAARIGLALTAADAGDPDTALAELHGLPDDDLEVLLARGYAWERKRDFLQAAHLYGRALALSPGEPTIARRQILAVAAMGAPHLALEMTKTHPDALSPTERDRLMADRAAAHVRWGELRPERESRRFDETDRALLALDEALGRPWTEADLSLAPHRRLVFDRMVALRDRVRMAEVVAAHRELVQAGAEIPDYALNAAADAYLYLEHPELARDLYLDILSRRPDHYNSQLALFYAYVELNDFERALPIIDDLVQRQPIWRRSADPRWVKDNPKRLESELGANMGRAYADDLASAELELDRMLRAAPANTDIRAARATVYRWRGWPRRALAETRLALRLEPELLPARIGEAGALLELRRYREAGERVAALEREYPEHKHVRALVLTRRLVYRPELVATVSQGNSSGGVLTGSKSLALESFLYSGLIDDRLRLFLHHRFTSGRFDEGVGVNHRVGVGAEQMRGDLRLHAELSEGLGNNDDLGLTLGAVWEPTDQWMVTGQVDNTSDGVPLRGLRAGVRGLRLDTELRYRWHESAVASVGYALTDFDDGNLRHEGNARTRLRLSSHPDYKLLAHLELFGSSNRRNEVVYFSPKSDASAQLALESRWLGYRRYDQSIELVAKAGGGAYWQEDFGARRTWLIELGFDWSLSRTFKLSAGARRARRVYDGDPELENSVFASVNVIFE